MLAASRTAGGGVLFDATTGEMLADRLAPEDDLEDAAIHDLAFSADGEHMIYIASRGGSPRFVKTVKILTP